MCIKAQSSLTHKHDTWYVLAYVCPISPHHHASFGWAVHRGLSPDRSNLNLSSVAQVLPPLSFTFVLHHSVHYHHTIASSDNAQRRRSSFRWVFWCSIRTNQPPPQLPPFQCFSFITFPSYSDRWFANRLIIGITIHSFYSAQSFQYINWRFSNCHRSGSRMLIVVAWSRKCYHWPRHNPTLSPSPITIMWLHYILIEYFAHSCPSLTHV